jgi:hypothetical protein
VPVIGKGDQFTSLTVVRDCGQDQNMCPARQEATSYRQRRYLCTAILTEATNPIGDPPITANYTALGGRQLCKSDPASWPLFEAASCVEQRESGTLKILHERNCYHKPIYCGFQLQKLLSLSLYEIFRQPRNIFQMEGDADCSRGHNRYG